MGSLVTELQMEALDSKVPVTDLLRKALVVAKKLKIQDFEKWIQQELNGNFPDEPGPPPYRHMKGEVKASHPYYGFVPVVFDDPMIAEALSIRQIGQPIGEIETLVNDRAKSSICQVPFPPELQKKIGSSIGPATLIVGHAQMRGIIDAVRNIVLDWALKLEGDGILGDEISFSDKEKQKAANVHYTIV